MNEHKSKISSMHFVLLIFVFKAGYMRAPLCLAACFQCNIWKNLHLRLNFYRINFCEDKCKKRKTLDFKDMQKKKILLYSGR